MKTICVGILLCCLLSANSVFGQQTSSNSGTFRERVYVSTDKASYVAGECMWLSFFCYDAANGRLSDLSNVIYVELQDDWKSVMQIKTVMQNGRGGTMIELPALLPTGNYRLTAYTRYMQNEPASVFFTKIVSIYNTLNTEKTTENKKQAQTVHQATWTGSAPSVVGISVDKGQFSTRSAIPINVTNKDNSGISYSISIYGLDSLDGASNPNITQSVALSKDASAKFTNRYVADYKGEVVRGNIINTATGKPTAPGQQSDVYLSVVGSDVQVYNGKVATDGSVAFFTNIFGNPDIVAEIYPAPSFSYKIVLDSPFEDQPSAAIPALPIRKDMEKTLVQRSLSMQVGHRFYADTLHTAVTSMHSTSLAGSDFTYLLDNYTRFPLMREVISEFVAEARFRTIDNQRILIAQSYDAMGNIIASSGRKALVLLDGVPVFDHEKIYDYNPKNVKSIDIYKDDYTFGSGQQRGMIHFKTYNSNFPNLALPDDALISDYIGIRYPYRFACPAYDSPKAKEASLPDWRHTLYWDGEVVQAAGISKQIVCYSSDYTGEFVAVIEGITESGQSFREECRFTVIAD